MINDQLHKFLSYLKNNRRYSAHTLTNYQIDLSQFCAYLNNQYNIALPSAARQQHIRSWLTYLVQKQQAASTINRKLSAVKSLYKFLLKEGQVPINPAQALKAPKLPKRLPVFVDEKEIAAIVDNNSGALNEQQALMLQLLYVTGMRKQELINLTVSDVDVSNQQIRVLGKGNKERFIPVAESLLSKLLSHASTKESLRHFIFSDKNGKQLSPKSVYNIVNQALQGATSLTKKSPHVLRHTFATHLMNNGADINAVKELLGHSSLAATQVYTHNSISQLKEVHQQSHPKA